MTGDTLEAQRSSRAARLVSSLLQFLFDVHQEPSQGSKLNIVDRVSTVAHEADAHGVLVVACTVGAYLVERAARKNSAERVDDIVVADGEQVRAMTGSGGFSATEATLVVPVVDLLDCHRRSRRCRVMNDRRLDSG